MNIEEFKQTFQQINKTSLHLLESIYEPNVVFQDPLHRIEGLNALRDYFSRMYENVSHIEFDFITHIQQNDTHMLTWEMHFSHPRLNSGRPILVPGCSHLKFADKCLNHRDYFDLGALLYENISGLGTLIRFVKGRA